MRNICLFGLLYYFLGTTCALSLTSDNIELGKKVFKAQCEGTPHRSVLWTVTGYIETTFTCYVSAGSCEKDGILSQTWIWDRQRTINTEESQLLKKHGLDTQTDNVCVFETKIESGLPFCKHGWTLSLRKDGPAQCYKTEMTHPKTYDEAKAICRQQGATLPQITSNEDYKALMASWKEILPDKQTTDQTIFIGLAAKTSGSINDFVWDFDGTTYGSRSNQYPQFAGAISDAIRKKCAILRDNYDYNRMQQWYCDCVNQDCGYPQFQIAGVACQMPAQQEPQYFCGKGYQISRVGQKVLCTKAGNAINATTSAQYFCEDNWYLSKRPYGPAVCMKTEKYKGYYNISINYDQANAVCKAQGSVLPQLLADQDVEALTKSWHAVMAAPRQSVYLGIRNYAIVVEKKSDKYVLRTGYRTNKFIWDFDGTVYNHLSLKSFPTISIRWDRFETQPTIPRCVTLHDGFDFVGDWPCDCVTYFCPLVMLADGSVNHWAVQAVSCMKLASTIST